MATVTATASSAAKPGEFGFFPSDGACCVVGWVKLLFLYFISGLRVDGCAVGGCFAANASFISKSDGDSGRYLLLFCERVGVLCIPADALVFRSLVSWPSSVDFLFPPVLAVLTADALSTTSIRHGRWSWRWLLRLIQSLASCSEKEGGPGLAPMLGCGGRMRGCRHRHLGLWSYLVVILFCFRVFFAKCWGCTVLHF
ncbi:hypothetical protein PVAP13_3NG146301 [Panicum virgatum]|uniref:Uncharacterized protein n=1 Tax=Panicum virgatum TaxID=38727 RepID=A0A8T0UBY0_PANVG|nr:hypothetical protein PVAP13_3NG146301 [Panicum virgatum]